jgi:hypothetical protein
VKRPPSNPAVLLLATYVHPYLVVFKPSQAFGSHSNAVAALSRNGVSEYETFGRLPSRLVQNVLPSAAN